MKRLLCSSLLLALLTACSTVPLESPETAPSGIAPATSSIALKPLVVPPASAFHTTRARALSGHYQKASWASLPGWDDDSLDHVWKAFVNNCKGLMRPVSGSLTAPARATPRAWQPVCAAAKNSGIAVPAANKSAVRAFMQQWLQPWQVLTSSGKPASGMVTGYYEPLVHASRTRGGAYQWPLYAPPADLLTIDLGSVYPDLAGKRVRGKLVGNRVVPYDTRAQIATEANKPPVIVWVNDPVDAFFLEVQGSGRAQLPNGQTIRLAYTNHNGRPYKSIGRWLVDQGQMPLSQASMQNIKAWAKRNPGRVQEMLNVDPAVVFFNEKPVLDPELGPSGAYGIPLIGQRSIAVDPTFVPLGSPVFLATSYPATHKPLNRLVFAQDTGAAIKGAARADFFWGYGDQAGDEAGRMKQHGQMWVLWPKHAGKPTAR